MIDLKNKNIILTGATGGIGSSILDTVISLNANVVETGTNEKTTNEGIIAPIVFFILSSVLVYGLSDKIYLS